MKKWAGLSLILIAVIGVMAVLFTPKQTQNKQVASVTTPNLAIIVPHHDMAKQDRLDQWQTLNGLDNITRVFIISPNHFGANQKTIFTGDVPMTTSRGDLEIVAMPSTTVSNDQMESDHGIFNLIGEIKQFTPKASLTPLLVGDKADISNVANSIKDICPNNCLIMASVDFSHYLSADISKAQDTETLKYLEDMNIENRPKIDTIWADSPKSLEIIQNFAKIYELKWHLYKADFMPQTSHILGEYRL